MPGRSFAELQIEKHWANGHRCAGWFTTPDGCEHYGCEPCAAEAHAEHDHEQHPCEHAEAQKQLRESIIRGDPQPPEPFHQLRRPPARATEDQLVMNAIAQVMMDNR